MLYGVPVEVAKLKVGRAGERRAEVGGQPAARLQTGLEEDTERHLRLSPCRKIPGVGRHVILRGNRRSLEQFERLAGDSDDPVEKLERRSWRRAILRS